MNLNSFKLMRKIFINAKMLMVLSIALIATACLKEKEVAAPTVYSMKMYMTDIAGKDSLITEPTTGKAFRFVVDSNADICTVWPSGMRETIKKKGTTDVDSIDMFGHPLLKSSDFYTDYGLVGARGLKTSKIALGWSCNYTYKTPGEYDVTIIVTNHGYDDSAYKQVVVSAGKVTVR